MRRLFLSLITAAALTASLRATPIDPANFTESTFLSHNSISLPTGLAWAPDGSNRLFVTCKGNGNGTSNSPAEIRVIQNGVLQTMPFASFNAYGREADNTTIKSAPASDPVYTYSECGLLGICFDPDFLVNRYVYVFATVSPSEQQIIRFTDTLSGADSIGTNKTTLVPGLPTNGVNHDGGGIGIGPDGRIYWSIGDNANNTGVDGNLVSMAAKVGRANRFTGAAPNDNPFYDGAGPNADYIWARGCRNPFTLTFHQPTGQLWVNIVGSSPVGDTQPRSGPGFEQVFVVTRGAHLGWNDYENNQPPGYLAPVIAYGTNTVVTCNLAAAGATRTGGVTTFMTQSFHPFRKGAKVTIAGVADASFNGNFYVASRLNDAQFTVLQAGPDASSGAGTAATQTIGGSITGGTFYDSTAFPAAHHGNFYFGDVNTGRVMRATLDSASEVTSVDEFATSIFAPVDAVTGPDGALYVARHASPGVIRRIATTSAAQNMIVYPTAMPLAEGSTAVFTVRLAAAPASNVTVNVIKSSGDTGLNVASGAALTFTPANWNVLQPVTLSAAEDANYDSETATFTVSSAGLPSYSIVARSVDNDEPRLLISQANITGTEGGTTSFSVSLASNPGSTVNVAVARLSGDADINIQSGASLNFNSSNFSSPQTVTISAAEDSDNVADSAVIGITLPGEPPRTVNVSVTDNDPLTPTFTSTPLTSAIVNSPYSYTASANGNPAPSFSFATTPPAGMTINSSTGVVSWTPSSTGSFAVSIRAAGNGFATQNFTITVSADAAPVAALTRPLAGEILSGTTAEFFGDGFDDVGCVKAEFFVDGVLTNTDINSGNHYHHGGSHVLFNTTQFANGPHSLRMRVTDSTGQSGFMEVPALIANGAGAWKSTKFTAAEQTNSTVSGDLADPDGDGLANLFEYVTDSAPKSAASPRLPQLTTLHIGNADYLAIQFITARWANDVIMTVEAASSPAGPWTSIDPDDATLRVSFSPDAPSPGLDTRIVRDSQPLGTAQRFLRLRATRP